MIDSGQWGGGGESTVYIVFSLEQIKSATDNIGTFDERNSDIRYQVAGETYMKAPNGADTNLSEEQWNRVRGNDFRAILGNFDKAKEYEANLEKFYHSEPLKLSMIKKVLI